MTKNSVSYLGNMGSNSETAAFEYFGESTQYISCRKFEDIFKNVSEGVTEFGIVPIENSFTGPIYRNFDLMLENDLWISGENQLRIEHNLIVQTQSTQSTKIEDITHIYSHPQGFEQCQKFLNDFDHAEKIPMSDTAGGVKYLKESGNQNGAAIANKRAAECYGMKILKPNIEDISLNFTRFIILQKEKTCTDSADKISLVYSVDNTPGALYKSLSVFALRDIGLSKIESRPLHGKPWEYAFYVDLEENVNSERYKKAIGHLEEITDFIKVLGCYRTRLVK